MSHQDDGPLRDAWRLTADEVLGHSDVKQTTRGTDQPERTRGTDQPVKNHDDGSLRDAWRLTADEVLGHSDVMQPTRGTDQLEPARGTDPLGPTRETDQPERTSQGPDEEKIAAQARNQVAIDKATRFEWQKVAYDQRQRELAAQQELAAKRTEHMKANDPVEFAREQKEQQLRAERQEQEAGVKKEWADKAAAGRQNQRDEAGVDRAEVSPERYDATQGKAPNKWDRLMSDRALAAIEITHPRENEGRNGW